MKNKAEFSGLKNWIWLVYGLILIAILGVALALRIIPMNAAVFGGGYINMQGVDGIYHLRLVENLLAHFPNRITFDPYTFFPYGQDVYFAPLYDLLAAFCAWIIGLGSPDQHTIETVCAYFPAVLGALVTIPVYFIGRAILNRKTGLIAALIAGILPGTFLFRSRLGFFDHHVAEILFSTTAILFLFLALKQTQNKLISFDNFKNKQWKPLFKPLLFSVLGGLALGMYLLAWVGGLLFVFILFCWVVLTFVISHLRKESTDYVPIIGIPIFLIALLVVIPFLNQIAYSDLYVISLLGCLIVLVFLSVISKTLYKKNLNPIYYPLIIIGLGIIGILGLYLVSPSLFKTIMEKFQIFNPAGIALTVAEIQPLFLSNGEFSLVRYWSEFNTAAIIAPIGFILILISIFKKYSNPKILLLVWSLLVFLASAGQVRFTAYLVVTIALLAACFYSQIIDWIYLLLKWLIYRPLHPKIPQKATKKSKVNAQVRQAVEKQNLSVEKSETNTTALHWYKLIAVSLSLILVFFLGINPNIKPALATAGTNAGITPDWRASLLWMKDNTPLPFKNDDYYYALYQKPAEGQKYDYPSTAYGVMAWWDYGHIITQIAHRIPNSNPHQAGAASAASYFVAQSEASANKMLNELGSKYIVIDFDVALPYNVTGNSLSGLKFAAMPTWASTNPSSYAEVYFQSVKGKWSAVPIYYPEYYYTQVARLYNFHGEAVIPNNSTTVIGFSEQSGQKIIDNLQTFPTYEEATEFLKKQDSPNYRLVGLSPFISPVPLEKLAHYSEVYRSPSGIAYNNQRVNNSYIEIFKYTP